MEKIVIQVGGQVDLKGTTDALENLGKIDKKNADQFKKSNDEFVIAANKRQALLEAEQRSLEKTKERLKKAFTVEDINAFNEVIKDSEKKIKALQGPIEKTENTTKNLGNAFRNLASALPGGQIVSQFTNISNSLTTTTKATGGLSTGMKLLGGAIGGPLFVVLGGLIAYFTKTEKGAEALERGIAGISATVGAVIGRFARLGEGMAAIFSGEFKEGAKILSTAFTGIVKEIRDSTNAAIEFTGSLQDIEDAENNLAVINSNREKQVDILVAQSKKHNLSIKERIDLLNQADVIDKSRFDDQIKLQKAKVEALKKENDIVAARGGLAMDEITGIQNQTEAYRQAQIGLNNILRESEVDREKRAARRALLEITGAKKTGQAVNREIDINLNERIELEENANTEIAGGRTKLEQELYLSGLRGQKDWDDGEQERTRATKEAEQERTRVLAEQEKVRAGIKQQSFETGKLLLENLNQFILQRQQEQLQAEESKNQKETDSLISNLDKRKEAGRINEVTYNALKENIQRQSDKKAAEIKKKQFDAEKRANITKVAIETLVAVAKAISGSPLTFGLPFSAFALAQGGILAGSIAAQKTPAFKDGVIDLQGPGTETSDSIHARLSKGESVIKSRQTMKHKDALKAINEDKFGEYLRKYEFPNLIRDSLQDKRGESMAENIARSMIYQDSFNDSNLIRAIEKNRKVKIENINELRQERNDKRYSL